MESIKKRESSANVESIKQSEISASVQSIKKVDDIKKVHHIRNVIEVQSGGPNPKAVAEEILKLNDDGDIVGGKEDEVEEPALRVGHKNYFSLSQKNKSDFRGYSNKDKPAPRVTLLGKDGLNCSDDELRKQSLIAWRHLLKSRDEYRPDRLLPQETHEAHVKILMAALSDFKNERVRNQLKPRAKLFFKHDRYSMLFFKHVGKRSVLAVLEPLSEAPP